MEINADIHFHHWHFSTWGLTFHLLDKYPPSFLEGQLEQDREEMLKMLKKIKSISFILIIHNKVLVNISISQIITIIRLNQNNHVHLKYLDLTN